MWLCLFLAVLGGTGALGQKPPAVRDLFSGGVVLYGRAKVFYDIPRGFSEALGEDERSHFGRGWKGHFAEEAKDAILATMVADNKRVYNWSIIGDWTVRLRYSNGLGILGLTGTKLADYAVHPNHAWIDVWNYSSSLNDVRGIGDFNGDGRDDILISSGWGIGIVHHDGTSWKALMVQPAKTSFGEWLYNSGDKIHGVGDFDKNGTDDILVSNSWGIGILTLSGSSLTSMIARAQGTSFDGWLFNPADNVVRGIGDFDGNGADDILMSSPWGMTILRVAGSTLKTVVTVAKGTSLNGWVYNPDDNVIQGIGDFDGNGADDILLTGSWGIGILGMQGSTLTTMAAQPKAKSFDGWAFHPDNVIHGVGDFDGDGMDEILITNPSAIGILRAAGSTFKVVIAKPTGTWFGGWLYNSRDNVIEATGDFDGDQDDDILISSPWGIGVLALTIGSLTSVDLAPHDRSLGAWYLQNADVVCGVGKLAGGPRTQILLKK